MYNIRSRGVTFWGNLFIVLGIFSLIVNSARNIWRFDYLCLPILYLVIGLGILNLKNWARITAVLLEAIIVLDGVLQFFHWVKLIQEMAYTGKNWLALSGAVISVMFRFVIGLGAILFFLQPTVKEQFHKGEKHASR